MEEQVVTTSPIVKKSWPVGKIILGIVILIMAGMAWVYAVYAKPYITVGRAFLKLNKNESMQIAYSTESGKTTVVTDYAGKGALSQFTIRTSDLLQDENKKIELQLRADEKDMYIHGSYTKPEEVTKFVAGLYPRIDRTKTFVMAKSLWTGEKWLHFALPEAKEENKKEDFKWDDLKTTEEGKRFAKNWVLAVKPGPIEEKYEYEGAKYTKVTFGFDKERLIEAINSVKDLDVNVKVDQVNSLIKAVKSSDGWDKELVQVLIDQEGIVRIVKMQIPEIDEETLNASIQEGVGESGSGAIVGQLGQSMKDLVWGKAENKMVSLGTVRFDKLDEVKAAERPTVLVEAPELMSVAQQELGPIIAALLTAGSNTTRPQSIYPNVPSIPTASQAPKYVNPNARGRNR